MFKERKLLRQQLELLAKGSKNCPWELDLPSCSRAMLEIYRELLKPIRTILFSLLIAVLAYTLISFLIFVK